MVLPVACQQVVSIKENIRGAVDLVVYLENKTIQGLATERKTRSAYTKLNLMNCFDYYLNVFIFLSVFKNKEFIRFGLI